MFDQQLQSPLKTCAHDEQLFSPFQKFSWGGGVKLLTSSKNIETNIAENKININFFLLLFMT